MFTQPYFSAWVPFQGYISIGLEERLKYLRRPQKRPQKEYPSATDGEAAPPPKRKPKPVMPQVLAIGDSAVGEDEASHQWNVEKLKSLSKQVRRCTALYLTDMYMGTVLAILHVMILFIPLMYTIHGFWCGIHTIDYMVFIWPIYNIILLPTCMHMWED